MRSTTTTTTTASASSPSPPQSSSIITVGTTTIKQHNKHLPHTSSLQYNPNTHNNSRNDNKTIRGEMTLVEQILSASAGALLTTFVVTPFDVVKTQIQVNRSLLETETMSISKNASTIGSLKYILQKNGARGLWRGLSPSLLMQVPGTGLYYSAYENLKYVLNQSYPKASDYHPLVAGCLARIVAATVTSPLEFMRTVSQANLSDNRLKQHSVISLLKMMTSGQVSPWTGLGITLLRDAPFSALYWFSYEKMKSVLMQNNAAGGNGDEGGGAAAPLHQNTNQQGLIYYAFVSGALSGMLAAMVTNPLDVIKSEIQANGFNSGEQRIWQTTKNLYREGGIFSFSRGWIPRTVKVTPACGIMISTYEVFKSFFLQYKQQPAT